MDRFYELQDNLSSRLNEIVDESQKKEEIVNHLHRVTQISLSHHISKLLRTDQDWLNTERPLSWEADLSGRVLVLDFFTYCCVNCLHVLPILKRLEEHLPPESGLAVVGVHSAKFLNERDTANVASAVLQYDVAHCVVNDPTMELWNKMQISCWPTLFVIGPNGEPLFILMGESQEAELFLCCQVALDFFRSSLSPRRLPLRLLRDVSGQGCLRFPGKVTTNLQGQEIVVTDTGNNRILVLTLEGVVKEVIGGPESGFEDGDLRCCRFNRPQGAAIWKHSWIYVADTGNHAIRLIDLSIGKVTTVVGTGRQGMDQEGGRIGTQQPISTPWDLCIAPPFGSSASDEEAAVLYIAMAGLHQIWAYFLQDCAWPKRSDPVAKGTCLCVAGSGREENKNNAYPLRACFAQPSGLTYSPALRCLFVADSESSSVRSVSLNDGSIRSLVGGSWDPSDLFAFGDQDGTAFDAKLQHPLGVAWCQSSGLLYVADTYNHKLKAVDPTSKLCRQVPLDCSLHEPGGLCVLGNGQLLVADTRAHSLLRICPSDTKPTATQVPIVALSSKDECCVDGSQAIDDSEVQERSLKIRPGSTLTVTLRVTIQEDLAFSQEAPQMWSLQLPRSGVPVQCCGPTKGQLDLSSGGTVISLDFPEDFSPDTTQLVRLSAACYVCEKALNVCLRRDCHWVFSVTAGPSSSVDDRVDLLWNIKK